MSTNSKEEMSTEMIIRIYKILDEIYPERFAPGEIPYVTGHYSRDLDDDNIETPIQKRIREMITHGKGFLEYIDYKRNPELAPKKYYSDGVPIDWHNLDESNDAYCDRCEKDGYKLPEIETAISLYLQRN